jgi:hypothetical protein
MDYMRGHQNSARWGKKMPGPCENVLHNLVWIAIGLLNTYIGNASMACCHFLGLRRLPSESGVHPPVIFVNDIKKLSEVTIRFYSFILYWYLDNRWHFPFSMMFMNASPFSLNLAFESFV